MLGKLLEQGITKTIGGEGIEGVELLRMPRGLPSIEPFKYVESPITNPLLGKNTLTALSTTNIEPVYTHPSNEQRLRDTDPEWNNITSSEYAKRVGRITKHNVMKEEGVQRELRFSAFEKSKIQLRLLASEESYCGRLAKLLDNVRLSTGAYIVDVLSMVSAAYERLPNIAAVLESLGQTIKNMWLELLNALGITTTEAIDLGNTLNASGFKEGDVFSNDRV